MTTGNCYARSAILPGRGLWARVLYSGVSRYTHKILPPQEGQSFPGYGKSCADSCIQLGNRSQATPNGVVPQSDIPEDTKAKNGGAELFAPQTSDNSTATSGLDGKDTSADIATQFRCRICNKPPSVGTQPTATFCGHIFCYK